MRRAFTALLAALGLLAPGSEPAAGQERTTAVASGDRVRYAAAGDRLTTGMVVQADDDAIVVQTATGGDPVRVPLSALRRLEVARGQRRLVREGALIGLVPGAAFGFWFGHVVGCDDQGPDCLNLRASLAGAAIFGAPTAAVGALAGLAFKVDRWERVRVPRASVQVAPVPGRGAAVAVRDSF